MPEKILIVEDEARIVRTLSLYLEKAGYEVTAVSDGKRAIPTFQKEKPGLVLLDLNLPHMDGLDICREMRKLHDVPIIMLTARIEETDRLIGLELGADDYITKPFNPREVVARVRALLRRSGIEKGKTEHVLKLGNLQLDLGQYTLSQDGTSIEVTPTEFNILKVLMESPGQTFSREELLEKALGYGYEGLGRTLDTHIRNLRKKIEPDPKNPTHIQTVYSIGYRMVEGGH